MIEIDRRSLEHRLMSYVGIRSVNGAISGGNGEGRLADQVYRDLKRAGLGTVREPVLSGGRDNIIAHLPGRLGAPVLMLHAHMDTVALSGKATDEPVVVNGAVHGRGACDTKGSLVAAIEAVMALRELPQTQRATVLLVASIDEEVGGTGATALVNSTWDIDMAVVGEPTGLEVAIAHKGVLRFEIRAIGVPAHSSSPHLGINAIQQMTHVIGLLENQYLPKLSNFAHPLVGSPTLNISTIRGGTGLNIVPSECVVALDRRLIPGEDADMVLATIDEFLSQLRTDGVILERSGPSRVKAAIETPPEHPIVQALGRARRAVLGSNGSPVGVPFSTDASIFAAAGIPCVVFGPGSIDQAHADDEWVSLEQTADAAEILAHAVVELADVDRLIDG